MESKVCFSHAVTVTVKDADLLSKDIDRHYG